MSQNQLIFDLPYRAALGAEDFLVSDCNLAAVALIDSWPDWSLPVQALIGPPASGKTHLLRTWQERSGAEILDPATLQAPTGGLAHLETRACETSLAVEDLDEGGYDDKALFHLLNLARERPFFLLLTARTDPNRWAYKLPDLVSRFSALPVTKIGAPDEGLLRAVMLKHFYDRQLAIEPAVLEFLARRIDRSLEAAASAVDLVDREALRTGRKITRQLVGEALERAGGME